ncbi:uncharacterized protein SAPINGB_P005937 [Magnusiomyces paraingens]|uniref:Matrin-type domain-containing protein n=1 Tax=Magnusiomyces paraingens TaxID=2606893 RepID=A0A5E8C4E5_9ASCO|nr:uncharacterized protein SAPINGB_P005937 [Saprochaete ingens]VVT57900.1 unnamed protein product [Saprochaete ingens]
MDYQNRVGSKKGGGGLASWSQTNANLRERQRKLALESIDLAKDPYIFKNHLGLFECKLCLTTHVNDGSYLSHTQGRKHQLNLARREAKERESRRHDVDLSQQQSATGTESQPLKRKTPKIGRPGYNIMKVKDPLTRQLGLTFHLEFPEIALDEVPRYRFMSAFEQRVDLPPDKRFQYLIISAEPYENCAFKIDAREIDQRNGRFWTYFDKDTKDYYLQLFFNNTPRRPAASLPAAPVKNN